MQASRRLGAPLGIPLYLDATWLAVAIWVAAGATFESPGWMARAAIALTLLASAWLHELGHALAARAQGLPVGRIVLFCFGGVASLERAPWHPAQMAWVAAAGPAASLALGTSLGVLALALPPPGRDGAWAAAALNLTLAGFNLLPGLPLDGGHLLQAALWQRSSDRLAAGHWAARAGQGMGVLVAAGGLAGALLADAAHALWLALIGGILWRSAQASGRSLALQATLVELKAADALHREVRWIAAHSPLRALAQAGIRHAGPSEPYYALAGSDCIGKAYATDLHAIERSAWDRRTVGNIARPLAQVPTVRAEAPLAVAVEQLEQSSDHDITVVLATGEVVGPLTRADVARAIAARLPREASRWDGGDGYPPDWALPSLASATLALPDLAERVPALLPLAMPEGDRAEGRER
ncbi:MAG: hypothetical protein BRC58_07050 [Cyanobacteria bacterium QS_8_64_29]|nr:MAG: hypothetical protein BRC58_07050 [Cyanobacteria bacterium QS_8_64_29]